tara:strand:+ start:1686 stop:2531 length:846 start_codon:yes stop_codon:yes gene_type:complete
MNVKESLIERGVYSLFESSRYGRIDAEQESFLSALFNMPELLIPICRKSFDNDVSSRREFLNSVYRYASTSNIDLSEKQEWLNLCEDISSKISESDSNSILNGYEDYAIEAASHQKSFDWEPLFCKVYEAQKNRNYTYSSFRNILGKYASSNVDSFASFVSDEVFCSKSKPSYVTRSCLYSEYISQGLLSKKTARKMRSDGSSDASIAALKSLFDNASSYENFDDLVLQFSDSKYDDVVVYLAKNLPEYLLTSIMGTTSHWGKVELERRFRQIEREREQHG